MNAVDTNSWSGTPLSFACLGLSGEPIVGLSDEQGISGFVAPESADNVTWFERNAFSLASAYSITRALSNRTSGQSVRPAHGREILSNSTFALGVDRTGIHNCRCPYIGWHSKPVVYQIELFGSQYFAMPESPLWSTQLGTHNRFSNLLRLWRGQLTDVHYLGLQRRLDLILEEEPELLPSESPPDPASFSLLLAYLAVHPYLATPSIVFNRDGSFEAAWFGEEKLRASINFVQEHMVRWVFVDSRKGIQKAITGTGLVNYLMVDSILSAYGAFSWMTRPTS